MLISKDFASPGKALAKRSRGSVILSDFEKGEPHTGLFRAYPHMTTIGEV